MVSELFKLWQSHNKVGLKDEGRIITIDTSIINQSTSLSHTHVFTEFGNGFHPVINL